MILLKFKRSNVLVLAQGLSLLRLYDRGLPFLAITAPSLTCKSSWSNAIAGPTYDKKLVDRRLIFDFVAKLPSSQPCDVEIFQSCRPLVMIE